MKLVSQLLMLPVQAAVRFGEKLCVFSPLNASSATRAFMAGSNFFRIAISVPPFEGLNYIPFSIFFWPKKWSSFSRAL